MDPVRNPFAPGAGNPPPELAGRSAVLDGIGVTLRRIALGKPAQSSILVGLRGVGKTVLLTRIDDTAQREAFKTLYIEAHEDKSLPELLVPGLRKILISLSLIELGRSSARQALRVLSGFVRSIKMKVHDIDLELGIDPEIGAADSGDLEADLPSLFLSIGRAAKSAGAPIVILIDEMQYLKKGIQRAHHGHPSHQPGDLPVTLVGAGLPQILGLAGDSKSYAERLFKYPKIGALDEHDARDAILGPIEPVAEWVFGMCRDRSEIRP
ncbi:ATP-binding protein [Tistrella bauzanensis]